MPAAAGIAALLLKTAAIFVLNVVAQALFKPKRPEQEPPDTVQTRNRTLSDREPMTVVVGERIVGGVGMFDDTYGTELTFAVETTTVSCKPCGIDTARIYGDGELLTFSGDPLTAQVNVTNHFLGKNDVPRAKIRIFDGTTRPGTYLNGIHSPYFDTTDNYGEDTVFVAITENTDDDIGDEDDPDDQQGKVFIPFQGRAEFKFGTLGVAVCDPRSSGDYDDGTTYIRSTCPPLIFAQGLYGWYTGTGAGRAVAVGDGLPTSLMMDTARINALATACDNFGWECHGEIRSGSQQDAQAVLDTFAGVVNRDGPRVIFTSEAAREFGETIDLDDHMMAEFANYQPFGASTERPSYIAASYIEPDEADGRKELPDLVWRSGFDAATEVIRPQNVHFPFVLSARQALHLAQIRLAVSNAAGTAELRGLPFAYERISVETVITLANTGYSHGDGQWIVKARSRDAAGRVTLFLREFAGQSALDAPAEPTVPTNTIRPRPFTDIRPGGSLDTVTGVIQGRVDDLEGSNETAITPSSTGNSGADGATVSVGPFTASWGSGAGTVTYAWSFVSGGTGLTITDDDGASTSVTGTADADSPIFFEIQCVLTNDGTTSRTRTATGSIFGTSTA